MRRRAAALLILFPAACAPTDPADPAQVLQEVLATHQASIAGVGGPPAAAAAPPAVATAVAVTPAAARAPAASPPPAAAALPGLAPNVAGDLVGLSPEALRQRLGEPRLRREEGTAEIWHYQASQCHLDLVLYPEGGPRAGLRVAYAAARAVGTARRAESACLRDIARGATGPVRNAFAEPA
jgi:hypothetical protein